MRQAKSVVRAVSVVGLVAISGMLLGGCMDNKSPAMRAWERSTTAQRPASGQYMTASDSFGRMAFTPIDTGDRTVANAPTE